MEKKVSVIIPTYGRTNTLRRAIDSVLRQSFQNLEIIVVDDNYDEKISCDVNAIIDSYNSDKVLIVKNETNLGGALSRNKGIMNATGEYIAFLDDDDWYYPDKIKKQYSLIESNDKLGIVYSWVESINNDGSVGLTYRYEYRGNLIFQAMYDCMAATSQWLCRKSALLDIGMFSDVPCKQDSNVLLKMMLAGYEIDYVPEVLSAYDDSGNDRISTQNHQKRIKGEEMLRTLCRSNYYLITKEQKDLVEYSFAIRLFEHYYHEGKIKEVLTCMSLILKRPFDNKTKHLVKRILYKKI